MGTVIAWLLEKLTSKIALPIMAVMLVANIGTGIALEITRITLQHRTEDLAAEKATHAADIATYQAATAQAKALDQQHALTVKEGQDQVTTEKQHDLENQLASARAVAANFVRQHPAPAVVPSGRDNPPVPAAPDAPGSAITAGAETVIPASDADACAIDYTLAKGWADWWKRNSRFGRPDQCRQSGQSSQRLSWGHSNPPTCLQPSRNPILKANKILVNQRKKTPKAIPAVKIVINISFRIRPIVQLRHGHHL